MQKLLQAVGSIWQTVSEIRQGGHASVYLITGRHFLLEDARDLLKDVAYTHYVKTSTLLEEPEAESVFQSYKQSRATVLLAIGGGAVIDLAKMVISKCKTVAYPIPFLIAAPTTAGSGSEATQFAVLYKGDKKISVSDPVMLPALVILDPELTCDMPSRLAAISGMDVLAQAVESYWNIHATAASMTFAAEAIGLWNKYFIPAVLEKDAFARENMLWAAHLAGKAINITRTTGPHALSYYLTAKYQVPHGQAVALYLPVFFRYNKPGPELCRLLEVQEYAAAAEKVYAIMSKAGLAVRFSDLELRKDEIIDELLRDVNPERFANNPVPFNAPKLKKLILEYL